MYQPPRILPPVSSLVRALPRSVRNYFGDSYQIRVLLGALYAAVVADGIITRFLVQNGLASEGNPFLQFWVGEEAFLTLKVFGGLLAIFYLWDLYRRSPRLTLYCASLFLLAYTGVVFWNLLILF